MCAMDPIAGDPRDRPRCDGCIDRIGTRPPHTNRQTCFFDLVVSDKRAILLIGLAMPTLEFLLA